MNRMQEMVREFNLATGQPAPGVATIDELSWRMRRDLIREEAVEVSIELGKATTRAGIDAVALVKEVCDLLYVTFGAAVEMGVDIEPFFEAVHRSNMAKLGGPKRADGKQLKPEGWEPPDIAGLWTGVAGE